MTGKKKKTEFFIKHNLKRLTKNIYCTVLFIWYLRQIRFIYCDKRSEEQLLLVAGGRNSEKAHEENFRSAGNVPYPGRGLGCIHLPKLIKLYN